MITIAYRPSRTTPEQLAAVIASQGYKSERVVADSASAPGAGTLTKAPLPDGAPKFFADAFNEARQKNKPLLIDFWASWCGPCLRLKKETLGHPEVTKKLAGIQVIYVDLDHYPELGTAYGVVSVPDVFFIRPDGVIQDRLRNFEPPAEFSVRLDKLLSSTGTGGEN
ncbi:MAG: thioredoxin family protein [Planctomycetes bacterium]|nr:thioredoxin family protein [Planctomycetota bacterium]